MKIFYKGSLRVSKKTGFKNVDKNELLDLILKYYDYVDGNITQGKFNKYATRLAEVFWLMINKRIIMRCFRGYYSILEDMKYEAYQRSILCCNKKQYKTDKGRDAFAVYSYFTTLIDNAFWQVIAKEKKYKELKFDLFKEQIPDRYIKNDYRYKGDEEHEYDDYMEGYLKEYKDHQDKKDDSKEDKTDTDNQKDIDAIGAYQRKVIEKQIEEAKNRLMIKEEKHKQELLLKSKEVEENYYSLEDL